ncbi:histidine kinase [Actinomadura kijaniata]|uniref:sensor histidine kinase n=1 Tax=Actinomadura kijaniata TaxID=46161 RepID=UPI002FEB5FC7
MPVRGVDGTSWPRVADLAVPAAAATILLWLTRGMAAEPGAEPTSFQWTATVVTVAVTCAALVLRRWAPVPVFGVVLVTAAAGALLIDHPDTVVYGLVEVVALYSVAAHLDRRTATLGGCAAFAVALMLGVPVRDGPQSLLAELVLDAALYMAVVACGQLRRQRKERRRALAARLAAADAERRAAALAERHRLARDLHDVAGHHLSAVVVHSGAVAGVGDPELARQALGAAAEKGREVLKSLSRLVDVVGAQSVDGDLRTVLPPLCRGLSEFGVPVALEVEGRARRVPPEVGFAAYRIVQEALTNAVRYAAGAPVRVTVRYVPGSLELTVANDAPSGGGTAPGLGSGRGVAGMAERATELGGTLRAGPDAAGGWTVATALPTGGGPRRGPGWDEALDAAAIAMCAVLPLVAFTPPDPLVRDFPGWAVPLVAAALAARTAPLWWRRRAPRLAVAALAVTTLVCGTAAALWRPELLPVLMFGCGAEMVAVYSAACYGGRTAPTWPAALFAAAPWGVVLGLVMVEPADARAGLAPALLFGLLAGGTAVTVALLPFWVWGRLVAARSRHWETEALATMAAHTGQAVLAERDRVARGLRGGVLDHTGRLVRVAEAGLAGDADDRRAALTAAADEARAALTGMRALLAAMEEPGSAGRP